MTTTNTPNTGNKATGTPEEIAEFAEVACDLLGRMAEMALLVVQYELAQPEPDLDRAFEHAEQAFADISLMRVEANFAKIKRDRQRDLQRDRQRDLQRDLQREQDVTGDVPATPVERPLDSGSTAQPGNDEECE